MTSSFAWVLNLDADIELARPRGYTTPKARVRERLETMVPRLRGLMGDGDVRLTGGERLACPLPGRAFCPTPRALQILAHAGARLPPAPDLAVLRRVNSRRFCAGLGQTLSRAAFVTDLPSLQRLVATPTETGDWLLKRPYSFAGTGRRKVAVGPLSAHDEAWAQAGLCGEGLQIEPWVERICDLGVHGFVSPAGEITLGRVCIQRCSGDGAWQQTLPATDEVSPGERRSLEQEAERVAQALAAAGYFGPFGVDSYRYRTRGTTALNPRSEINGRYTMGWAVGMGERRPDRYEG